MAEQTVTVENATIVLSSIDDPFSDGRTIGYLFARFPNGGKHW